MASSRKQAILERHRTNDLLGVAVMSLSPTDPGDLSVEYPSRPVSETMVERAATALESGETHYVDVPGIGPLRAAVAEFLQESGIPDYKKDNVLITAGLQEARFLAIQKIGEEFGGLAVPSVVHPGVRQALGVRALDLTEIPVSEEAGLLPTARSIGVVLEQGVKLLYLESPSRLTGACFSAEAAQRIAELLEQHDAYLILDQGLAPLAPEAVPTLAARPGAMDRIAVIGELWPGAGLESWFIGYIGAKADWMARIQSQKQIMAICTSTATQYAALAAAEEYSQLQEEQQRELGALRDRAMSLAAEAGAVPVEGEVYSFVALRVDSGTPAKTLQEHGVQVADGAAFGQPNVIRVSIHDTDALQQALARFAQTPTGGTPQ